MMMMMMMMIIIVIFIDGDGDYDADDIYDDNSYYLFYYCYLARECQLGQNRIVPEYSFLGKYVILSLFLNVNITRRIFVDTYLIKMRERLVFLKVSSRLSSSSPS